MTFDLDTYHEFVRLLYQHPELRAEVRQLVLSEEILALPQVVHELTEAQKRSEEQLTRLEQVVAELAEAQKRTDEQLLILTQRLDTLTQRVDDLTQRLDTLTQRVDDLTQRLDTLTQRVDDLTQRVDALTQRVDELAEAQKRTEQRLEALARAQEETEKKVQALIEQVNSLTGQVNSLTGEMGNMRGELLEIRYHQRPFSFFGQLASRLRVVDLQEVWPELEERLSEEELNDLLALDMLLQGRVKRSLEAQLGRSEIWLAVEVSSVVDVNDIKRVRRRANLLQKAGLPVLAIAAGNSRTKGAGDEAKELGVIVQKDGTLEYLQEALAYWARMGAKSD